MITPTWDNVCTIIGDGDDDLHRIAAALGQEPERLAEHLQEMVDKGLLTRHYDDGVTRYRVCGGRAS